MNHAAAPIYEHEIQRIWAEQDFEAKELKTVDGRPIEVFFQVGGIKAEDLILRLPGSRSVMIFISDRLKFTFRLPDGRHTGMTGIRPTTR